MHGGVANYLYTQVNFSLRFEEHNAFTMLTGVSANVPDLFSRSLRAPISNLWVLMGERSQVAGYTSALFAFFSVAAYTLMMITAATTSITNRAAYDTRYVPNASVKKPGRKVKMNPPSA